MKNLRYIIFIVIVLNSLISSQVSIKSLQFNGNYSSFLDKKIAISKANGPGFGSVLQINLTEIFSVSVRGTYNYYTLEQDSSIQQWNWRFWNERYKGIVNDNLKSDTALKANIVDQQRMDLYNIALTFDVNYRPEFLKTLEVKTYLGMGALFYTRQLYLNETWKKYFRDVDYNFEYNYQNFAPNKNGNGWFALAGVEFGYQLSEIIMLSTGMNYNYVFSTKEVTNDKFPSKNYYQIKFGITFLY